MANRNADTYGDTAQLATPIAYDTTLNGWIDAFPIGVPPYAGYDDDWFSFDASEGNEYKITFDNLGVDQFPGNTFFPLHLEVEVKDSGLPGEFNTRNIEFEFGSKFYTDFVVTVSPDLSDSDYAHFDGKYYVQVRHSMGPAYDLSDVPYSIKVEKIVTPPDPLPAVVAPDPGSLEASLYTKDGSDNAKRHGDRIIKYFFDDGTAAGGVNSDGPWLAAEKQAAETAMARIAKYVDISFEEVAAVGDTDWTLEIYDTIAGAAGSMNFPGDATPQHASFNRGSNGWDTSKGGSVEIGGSGFATLVHEMLHGLGLGHPHTTEGNAEIMGGVTGSGHSTTAGYFNLNQDVFSAMSYRFYWPDGEVPSPTNHSYGSVSTPMAIDLAVLDRLYGLRTFVEHGNNTYTLPSNNAPGTSFELIYDTGGTDVIKASSADESVKINLNAATLKYEAGGGGWVSYTQSVTGGFTIANGVIIENAEGSVWDDTLTGNQVGNKLIGKGRGDILKGGGGRDTLDGGIGFDKLYGQDGNDLLLGQSGNDELFGEKNNDTLKGGVNNDTLDGGKNVDWLYGDADRDRILGGDGNDRLFGGTEKDTLRGGDDKDVLRGGSGNDKLGGDKHNDKLFGDNDKDTLVGGSGNDKLYGGAHNDTLAGNADNDILRGDGGNDRLAGGSGVDTALYDANSANFRAVKVGNKLKLIDKTGKYGTDTLSTVEWLKFKDKKILVKKLMKKLGNKKSKSSSEDEPDDQQTGGEQDRHDTDGTEIVLTQFEAILLGTDDLLV